MTDAIDMPKGALEDPSDHPPDPTSGSAKRRIRTAKLNLRRVVEAAQKEGDRLSVRVRLVLPWLIAAQEAGVSWRDLAPIMSSIVPFTGDPQDNELRLHRLRATVGAIRKRAPRSCGDETLNQIRKQIADQVGVRLPKDRRESEKQDADDAAETAKTTARALAQAVELLTTLVRDGGPGIMPRQGSSLLTGGAETGLRRLPREKVTTMLARSPVPPESDVPPESGVNASTTPSMMTEKKLVNPVLDDAAAAALLRELEQQQAAEKAATRQGNGTTKRQVSLGGFGVTTIGNAPNGDS